MKNKLFIILFIILGITQEGYSQWTWAFTKSSWVYTNYNSEAATYGTKGTAAPENTPGKRIGAASCTDKNGVMWLFGGWDNGNAYNDLWSFDNTNYQWTWQSGSNQPNESGVFGQMGVPSAQNMIGSKGGASMWADDNNNLWVYGGIGPRDGLPSLVGNDLWKYDIKNKTWTWMNGSSDAFYSSKKAVYGTMGVADPNNTPGARYYASNFKDKNGNLWLFAGNKGNDLWKYDINTGYWTWMKGNNTPSSVGSYGQKGVESASNLPDSRNRMTGMVDAIGNFWVFGGQHFNDDDDTFYLNDLWKFNIATNNWTWISGTKTLNHAGEYGILRVPSINNVPRSREGACGWINKDGHLVLSGGQAVRGYLNDTWFYNVYTQEWVWQTGSDSLNDVGYINRTDPDEDNSTSARVYATTWEDHLGTLWMFGGFGPKLVYDSQGHLIGKQNGNRNDMNKAWVPGVDLKTSIKNQSVVLGAQQVQLITVNVSEQSKYGATRIKVRTVLPDGLKFLSRKTDANNTGTLQTDNNSLEWYIPSLEPQSNVTLEFYAQIDPTQQTGDLQLCSDVYYQYAYENNQANNKACTTVGGSLIQTELIGWGSQWKYSSEGKLPSSDWYKTTYDDGLWKSGKAPLGYIDAQTSSINGMFGTVVDYGPKSSKYTTTYFRKKFNYNDSKVNDANYPSFHTLNIKRDDGVVVYLNGVEVYRQNMPMGPVGYSTNASQAVSFKTDYRAYIADLRNHTISAQITTPLVQGENLIAVEVHQCTTAQDAAVDQYNDLIFDLEFRSNHVNKSVPINAQTQALNITKGPYIQLLSPNSATLQWGTNLKSNSIGAIATELAKPFKIINTGAADNDTLHKVTFTGLQPNTRYYYSIGYNKRENVSAIDAGFLVLSGDATNYFVTSPSPELNNTSDSSQYTRFWALGDMGSSNDLQFRVRNGYQKYLGNNSLDGIFLLGDNTVGFEDVTMGEGSELLLKYACFDILRNAFRNTVVWPTLGNHDYLPVEKYTGQNSAYFKNFSMPVNNETKGVGVGSNNKSYYSLDYSNIHFITLDPYLGGSSSSTGGTLFDKNSDQYKWLVNDLAAYNAVVANDATPKWLIVLIHAPVYNVGDSHWNDNIAAKVKDLSKNLFENNGVDFVLTSHEHSYQRTYFLKNDEIQQGGEKHSYFKASKNDGTLYATVGSSGRGVEGGNKNDVNRTDRDKIVAWMFSNESSVPNVINKGGSLDLRIFNTKLEGRFIDEDGMVRDSFFIVKTSKTFSQINLTKGQSTYLTAAWAGKYKWSHDGKITGKSAVVTPTQNTTYTITDPATGFSQSYTVNLNSSKTAHSLVPFGNYGWWSSVILPGGAPTESQWANLDYDNMYSNAKLIWPLYGQGNTDEKGKISLGEVAAGSKLMFKNYFYVGSGTNYSNYILSIYHEPRQTINLYINGKAFSQASTNSNTIANRKLTMFTIPSNLLTQGQQNTVTIGMAIPASNSSVYPYSLTFDAELVGVVEGVVPPPASKAFRVATTATEPICDNTLEANVSFITTNSPLTDINYVAMLSDGQDNEIVGANTQSPIRIKLPTDYDKTANKYTVQVLPRQVAANLDGSKSLRNLQLPTGQLVGGRAIRYEETDTLTLNFTGSPPFSYSITNLGDGQTNEKLVKLLVNPVTNTEYSLESVENTCGVGKSDGKATITVLKPLLNFEKPLPNQLWCNSFGGDVIVNVVNPPIKEHQYQVYLRNGSSNSVLVGASKTSPVRITIPDTLSERNDYYFLATYSDIPNQYYTSENSQNFPIYRTAKGSLTSSLGNSAGVLTGEKLQLIMNLEGTPPFDYVINYGSQDTLSGKTSLKQLTRSVSIPTANTFELQSINNVCGKGIATGKVEVSLITSVGLLGDISIEATPNPTDNILNLKLSLQSSSNVSWEIMNSSGQKIKSRSLTNKQVYFEQIDCSNLPSGVYFLRVFINEKAVVHKIVKY